MEDPLEAFVSLFTTKKIDSQLEGTTYFLTGENPCALRPMYMTVRLGTRKGKKFYPSVALLELLSKSSKRKAVVNKKSAWLFLCGKNILKEGIVSCAAEEGLVLIMNEKQENLGYGKITGAGITNLLDRGDFLRRER